VSTIAGLPFVWSVAGSPVTVSLSQTVMRELAALLESNTSSLAPEFGGLLLGRMEIDRPGLQTHVDAFEPFSIEYRYGPNFVLSRSDRRHLDQRLERLTRKGITPVGWCRSHERRGLYLDQRDLELCLLYFRHPASAFLLVRRDENQGAQGGFFVWEGDDMRRHASYGEFPLDLEREPTIPAAGLPPAPERASPYAVYSSRKMTVNFIPRAAQGIASEVLAAHNAGPGSGVEVGGILLGWRGPDQVLIEDFEPVLREHRLGSSYSLSEEERRALEETLEWFRTEQGSLSLLGFYRKQTRAESGPDEHDRELFDRYCSGPESLLLLLEPDENQAIAASFFVRSQGVFCPASEPIAFPAESPLELAVSPVEAPAIAAGALPVLPGIPANRGVDTRPSERRYVLPSPTRPSRSVEDEPEERSSHRLQWFAATVVLLLGGAVLGYLSVGSQSRPSAPTPRVAVPQSPATPVLPAGAATQAADRFTAPPAPAAASVTEVRATLEQWARTLRSGVPDAISAYYSPLVAPYFTKRQASVSDVRRSLAQSQARYGRPAILRISDIRITPLGEGRAAATFRKHWQTAGPRVFAGEAEDRLGLVKRQDAWKIASEQEVRVFWTHRGR
jgi:hypothetical protein